MISKKIDGQVDQGKGGRQLTRRGSSGHELTRTIIMYVDEVSVHTYQHADQCPRGCEVGLRSEPRGWGPHVIEPGNEAPHFGILGSEADIHRRS